MSKGLKALKKIEKKLSRSWGMDIAYDKKTFDLFCAVGKELQALEIIKNKKVNLEYLKCCKNYEQYKTVCSYWNEITQEEFDLLKEALS